MESWLTFAFHPSGQLFISREEMETEGERARERVRERERRRGGRAVKKWNLTNVGRRMREIVTQDDLKEWRRKK